MSSKDSRVKSKLAKVCLRDLSIQNFKAGKSASEIYEIIRRRSSLRTIRRWIKEFKDSKKLQNSKKPGRPRSAVTVSNKKKVKRLLKNFTTRKVITD
ncbi:hypothetical protein BpHYR1_031575 [Brachionus plicatilis]|uniref:Uncharacterized protein n=1 Tax=Brachionus plicatilis TaxID=10195 RepID=A0A3M7QRY6_BRAPC|nr:hypothetical protein BpHYR1_031575 [Brachionus plicatilis]